MLTHDLIVHWRETRCFWVDEKSGEFERAYIEPLLVSVNAAAKAIEKLDSLIAKVRTDCE
jgi:hypothetical protein